MPSIPERHGEILVNIERLLHPRRGETPLSESLAREIRERYASIFPLLEELCAATCPWCPDCCCSRAFIWFDLKDLLFLHFIGRPPPTSQPRPTPESVCRHLDPRGCRLPRIARPWICTWYVCPTQKRALLKKGPEAKRALETAFREIKMARKAMAVEFDKAVSLRTRPVAARKNSIS